MLAKLDDEQKHYVKVEILNVMRYAKNYYPPPVFPNLQQHRSNISHPNYSASTTYNYPLQFPDTNFQMEPTQHLQTVSQPSFSVKLCQISEASGSTRSLYSQISDEILSPTHSRSNNIASSPDNSELFDMSNQ